MLSCSKYNKDSSAIAGKLENIIDVWPNHLLKAFHNIEPLNLTEKNPSMLKNNMHLGYPLPSDFPNQLTSISISLKFISKL